jgi:hypothetical protein
MEAILSNHVPNEKWKVTGVIENKFEWGICLAIWMECIQ